MKVDTVDDIHLFTNEYYGVKPCKCKWWTPTTPQGWQSVLENIEHSVKNNEKIVMTKTAGYIITQPKHSWGQELCDQYKQFKPQDQYIQAHLYVSLFGFSELFNKHNDPDQNIFVVAGEGSADWNIEGYDDFVLDEQEVLYLPGILYHKAKSKGPRYSMSVVIETEESYNRDNTSGDLIKAGV